MRMMNLRTLTIGISLLLLPACANNAPLPEIPCPFRPLLGSITQEQRDAMDPEVYDIQAGNLVKMKGYAKKLEKRARCGNE